jgi:hypothetical protein
MFRNKVEKIKTKNNRFLFKTYRFMRNNRNAVELQRQNRTIELQAVSNFRIGFLCFKFPVTLSSHDVYRKRLLVLQTDCFLIVNLCYLKRHDVRT